MLSLHAATLRSIERSDDRETGFCGHPFSTLPLENPVFLQLRWNSHLRQIGEQFIAADRQTANAHAVETDETGEGSDRLPSQKRRDVLTNDTRHPVIDQNILLTT